MRLSTLLAGLPDSLGIEATGDLSAPVRALVVRPTIQHGTNRLFVCVDENWGGAHRRNFRLREPLADFVQRLGREGISGFVFPRSMRDRPELKGATCVFTDNTLAFMFRATEVLRDSRGTRRITAITGSVGKSTTKEMLTQALEAVTQSPVFSPPGAQNLYPAVAANLARSAQYRQTIIEVAGSGLAAMPRYDFAVGADVAIVTSVAEAHMDYMGDLSQIAELKGRIFEAAPPGGTAVINLDTAHSDVLVRMAVAGGYQIVTYGESPDATIRLTDYDAAAGRVTAAVGKERITYTLGATGKHMAVNSLAVLATLRAYRLPNWREGVAALAGFEPVAGRGNTYDVTIAPGVAVTMHDDSYNANPASMRASLESFASTAAAHDRRTVALLGDMLELGDATEGAHRELASAVRAVGFDEVHLIGEHMTHLQDELRDLDGLNHWEGVEALMAGLPEHLRDGDIVLAKASRSTGLFHALQRLVSTAPSS